MRYIVKYNSLRMELNITTFSQKPLGASIVLPKNLQYAVLRQLESIYAETIQANRFSVLNAYKASWLYILYLVLSVEYIFIVSGVFIVLAGYGALGITLANYGVASSLFWASMAPVSLAFSIIIAVNLLPLHFLKGWNIWVLTGISILVFSVFISIIGQSIWVSYAGQLKFGFLRNLGFVFGIYFVTRMFLLLINDSKLSFLEYKSRWQAHDLELSIPVQIRGKLISLSAQDQLVKITTDRGQHLIRESFTKAIRRIQKTEGIQVHRSHWVAKLAMRKIDQQSGRNAVLLANGQRIPVSESKVVVIRDLLNKI